ncbi:unnamed protein product, partial [Effrenium voratum]
HPVREIEDRDQVSMLSASQEGFALTGGKNQAQHFRIALLSKLNRRQQQFVLANQSPEADPNVAKLDGEGSDSPADSRDSPTTDGGGSKPVSRTTSRLKVQAAVSQGSDTPTSRSMSATALKTAARSASRLALENKEKPKDSKSEGSQEGKAPSALSLPATSSMRSRSNLSAMDGRKLPISGSIGTLREATETVEPPALLSPKA